MRKALLVGINRYSIAKNNLRGCVNDISQMSATLTKYFKFDQANIRLLADERATKANIIDRMKWLVQDAKPGDVLVFHYSGHGSTVALRDSTGKVTDPQESILCTYELNWDDPLTFREIGKIFAAPEGVNITSIIDSCHSGHDFRDFGKNDIIYKFIPPPVDIAHRSHSVADRGIQPIRLSEDTDILMTGCTLSQTSADAYLMGSYHGAFTFCLNQALASLKYTTDYLNAISKTSQFLTNNGFSQNPQLHGALKLAKWPIFGNPIEAILQPPAKKDIDA